MGNKMLIMNKKCFIYVLMSLFSIVAFGYDATMKELSTLPTDVRYFIVPNKRLKIDEKEIARYEEQAALLRSMLKVAQNGTAFSFFTRSLGDKIPQNSVEAQVAAETIVEFMRLTEDPAYEKAVKDLKKGKLSKECIPAIETLKALEAKLEPKVKALDRLGIYAFYANEHDRKEFVSTTDTLKNPAFNIFKKKSGQDLEDFFKAKLYEGWEWTNPNRSTRGLTRKTDYFPEKLTYDYDPEHPEYIIVDNAIIDKKTKKIVRIASLFPNYYVSDESIYKMAYLDNEYDIQSYPANIQHHVKIMAGLEQPTAAENAEIDRQLKNIGNAFGDYFDTALNNLGNTRKERRAKDEANKKGAKVLLQNLNIPFFTEKGYNWLTQIEKDKRKYFTNIFYPTRIDDLSFTFYSSNESNALGKPTLHYKVTLKAVPTGNMKYRIEETVEKWEGTNPFKQTTVDYLMLDSIPEILTKLDQNPREAPALMGAMPYYSMMEYLFRVHSKDFPVLTKDVSSNIKAWITVETDGTISEIIVDHRTDYLTELQNEIKRVLMLTSGLWIPGKNKTGNHVRSQLEVSIPLPSADGDRSTSYSGEYPDWYVGD